MNEPFKQEIGWISRYFPKHGVGLLEMTGGELNIGDIVLVRGNRTELYQKVESMERDHIVIDHVTKGMRVGLKTNAPVRRKDRVYRIIEDE